MSQRNRFAERPAGSAVAELIARNTGALHASLEDVRRPSVENLHGARIAVRRFRTDLGMFDRILAEEWANANREGLRRLGRALAPIRHVDALVATLADVAAREPKLAGDAVAASAGLGGLRHRYLADLCAVLRDSPWLAGLPVEPEGVPLLPYGDAALPARFVFPGVVHRPLARLTRHLGVARPGADCDGIRVLARHCRYVAEAVDDVVPGARRLARAATRLHEALGDLQDARRLADYAVRPPGGAVLSGRLREHLGLLACRRAAAAKRAWPAALVATVAAGDRIRTPPDAPPVLLSGGLVVRVNEDRHEILLVHSPRRNQWSLPKGRAEPGENPAVCAAREVSEETGVEPRLHAEAVALARRDRSGRRKVVSWWMMTPAGNQREAGRAEGGGEVDAVRWLPVVEARELLTKADRRVLRKVFARIGEAGDGMVADGVSCGR